MYAMSHLSGISTFAAACAVVRVAGLHRASPSTTLDKIRLRIFFCEDSITYFQRLCKRFEQFFVRKI